ncbi:MAG: polysaccharide deacetylase family protein [Candidatus Omnitrophota bacterium]|nr:polysaccharide deacetylase family protein [Candidatus Omnitrophota bacterium]
MKNKVSIIMYHYVREFKNSRFPEIKGLSLLHFRKQLKYLIRCCNIISMEELIYSLKYGDSLPKRAALLTFDDGYADHFINVFPLLKESGVSGSFFPPVKAVTHSQVLDVNKIHFILASINDKQKLVEEIFSLLDEYKQKYSLECNRYYFRKLAVKDRFDTKEVVFIKRILQKELPEDLRNEITGRLFNKYVTKNEKSFCNELYLNVDQLKCMKRNGMYIGSHGFGHSWLNEMDEYKQKTEIALSLSFLHDIIGCDIKEWVMCYPYGSYNDFLLKIIKDKGCVAGLTTEPRIADLTSDRPLTLPRLDVNDLIKIKGVMS